MDTVMKATKALVRFGDDDAGTLEMLASDQFRFTYLPTYIAAQPPKMPISLSMRVREEPYLCDTLHPFFDNLLFEGEQLRLLERKLHLNRQSRVDRFKMLMVSGQQTLSPVRILPYIEGIPLDPNTLGPNQELDAPSKQIPLLGAYTSSCPVCLLENLGKIHKSCTLDLWGTTKPVSMQAFTQDPQNIFKVIHRGQSISGAQRKALFHLNRRAVLQRFGEPTHILKPDGDYPEMPANEHLTMAIAKHLKFKVPPAGLFKVDEIGLIYAIRRFDREPNLPCQPVEDMAQLATMLAEDKSEGTMDLVARLIKEHATSGTIEAAEFFRRLVFCFVTGNGDMHLKNWSLYREGSSGFVKLAPVYDFLNVRASFPQERVESILSLNGKQTDLSLADFTIFADSVLSLRPKVTEQIIGELPRWHGVIKEFAARSALSAERRGRYLAIVEERMIRMHSPSV